MIEYKQMDYLLWRTWCNNCNEDIDRIIDKFLGELIDKYNVININGNYYPEEKVFRFEFNFKYGKKKRKYGINYRNVTKEDCPYLFEIWK